MLRDVQLPAKELAINREIEIESVGRREGGGGGVRRGGEVSRVNVSVSSVPLPTRSSNTSVDKE